MLIGYLLHLCFAALKVLVHGSAEATEHLKEHCLKNVCPHVFAPQIEESIDVTSDLCAYKVSSFMKQTSQGFTKSTSNPQLCNLEVIVI